MANINTKVVHRITSSIMSGLLVAAQFGVLVGFALRPLPVLAAGPGEATSELGEYDGLGNLAWAQTTGAVPVGTGSFDVPGSVAVDSVNHRLYTADYGGNRILEFDLDSSDHVVGHAAAHVIGQSSFVTNTADTSQTGLDLQEGGGLAYDSTRGYLFVADAANSRVMVFNTNNLADDMPASFVLGQTDFVSEDHPLTQTGLWQPQDVAYDASSKLLYVADTFNDRVMVFDTTSLQDDEPASYVLGEPDFLTDNGDGAASDTCAPEGLAVDPGGQRLFVGDVCNSRVLIFDTSHLSSYEPASVALGQTDLDSDSPTTRSASSVNDAEGLSYDAANQRLFVSDYGSSRVLVFDVANPSNNEPASSVYGQPNLASGNGGTSQLLMHLPEQLSYDPLSHELFVADSNNARILEYDMLALSPGTAGGGQIGNPYSAQMSAQNASGELSYSLHSGSLPPGLNMDSDGLIGGTPAAAGSYQFVVRVNDSIGPMGTVFDDQTFTVNIADAPMAPSSPGQSSPSTPAQMALSESEPEASPVPDLVLNDDPSFTDSSGTSEDMVAGQSVQFYNPTAPDSSSDVHTATVTAVGSDYADVEVHSNPIYLHLLVGQTQTVALSTGGAPNLAVTLVSVAGNKANLVFKWLMAPTPKPAVVTIPQTAGAKAIAPASSLVGSWVVWVVAAVAVLGFGWLGLRWRGRRKLL